MDGSPSVRSERMNELLSAYATSPNYETLQQLRLQHVAPWAIIYSRSFIQAHGLRFDAVRRGKDISFNVLAAVQACRLRAKEIPVYRVYRRDGSLTTDMSAKTFIERFLVNRSLAQRLAALGIRRARPATGQMLISLRYGPRVVFKVWILAFFSPMHIDFWRIFDLGRWRRFITKQRRHAQERIK